MTNSLRSTLGAQPTAGLPTGANSCVGLLLRLGVAQQFASVARPVTASLAGFRPTQWYVVVGAGAPLGDRRRRSNAFGAGGRAGGPKRLHEVNAERDG